MTLTCEHDNAKLKEEKTNAGIIFRCPRCLCVYRLMVANNDKKCWNKRFPIKIVKKNEPDRTNNAKRQRRNRAN